MKISFILNGEKTTLEAAPDCRVVDLLREQLQLTGTKEACGSGECGACTIRIDGQTRLSCLLLAAQLEGRIVQTIEGLASGDRLHPVQEAFVAAGAIQCGFCTPGMALTAADLIEHGRAGSVKEIREGISGNLCRCTGYQKIVEAVQLAVEKTGKAPQR